jgi:hypothetical protein
MSMLIRTGRLTGNATFWNALNVRRGYVSIESS